MSTQTMRWLSAGLVAAAVWMFAIGSIWIPLLLVAALAVTRSYARGHTEPGEILRDVFSKKTLAYFSRSLSALILGIILSIYGFNHQNGWLIILGVVLISTSFFI